MTCPGNKMHSITLNIDNNYSLKTVQIPKSKKVKKENKIWKNNTHSNIDFFLNYYFIHSFLLFSISLLLLNNYFLNVLKYWESNLDFLNNIFIYLWGGTKYKSTNKREQNEYLHQN